MLAANLAGDRILDECYNALSRTSPPSQSSDETIMIFRIMMVVRHKPCELRILGYRIEPGDPVKIMASIAMIQFLSFAGLSSLLDD